MNHRRVVTALAALLALVTVLPAARAQTWKVIESDWCRGSRCEVREITLEPRDDVAVRSVNGGIDVESWDRNEIKVLAKVSISRMSRSDAEELLDEIEIETDGVIKATGPRKRGGFLGMFKGRGWSVSYRLMVPADTDLDLHTTNGGIEVSDVAGAVDTKTTNGSIKLYDVGGDVFGGTTNGGIRVELDADDWKGERIDLRTTNGGIKVYLPDDFSGRVDVATTNGGISVDQPVTINSKKRNRLKGEIGDGGRAVLKARTTNGGVSLRRADA
jgi:DUF4097 and DUF4098 domain-containing protein YvlB